MKTLVDTTTQLSAMHPRFLPKPLKHIPPALQPMRPSGPRPAQEPDLANAIPLRRQLRAWWRETFPHKNYPGP